MIDAKKHKQQVDDDDDDEEDYDEDEGGFEEAQSTVYRDLVRSDPVHCGESTKC